MSQKRINIAHRGAASLAPENTMTAFEKAWQVGAHGIETDISITADGVLILVHDHTFNRTTDVAEVFPGRKHDPLHTFTWPEVQALDAGSWFVREDPFSTIAGGFIPGRNCEAMTHLPVPSLEELLDFVKNRSWFVNLEIKRQSEDVDHVAVIEQTLQLVINTGLSPEQFSISSFEHSYLRTVMKHWPEIEVNALIGENVFIRQDWGNYDFQIYNANVDLIDGQQLKKAHQRGCRINLYTINNPSLMYYYLERGVEKIITDYPQLLTAATAGGN